MTTQHALREPEATADVSAGTWALVASQVATAILSWKYFFAGPTISASLAALLVAYGAVRRQREMGAQ